MGAEPLLVGDPIPVGKRLDGLYQRAVPEHNAVMARLSQSAGVPFLDLGMALPLTDDIRVQDKYLNAEGQRRQAALLFGFLRASGLIDRLLARPRETGIRPQDLLSTRTTRATACGATSPTTIIGGTTPDSSPSVCRSARG
jgi:hypothetical protein